MPCQRRYLLFGWVVLVVVAIAAVVGPWRVTAAHYERVRLGMTEEEVEAVLGPPGQYNSLYSFLPISHTWGVDYSFVAAMGRHNSSGVLRKAWECGNVRVLVTFDQPGGRVVSKALVHPGPNDPDNRHEP